MVVAISVVNRTSRKMVIVALTGLKTRPGFVWNWADVVMMWPLLPMLSIPVRRFPAF